MSFAHCIQGPALNARLTCHLDKWAAACGIDSTTSQRLRRVRLKKPGNLPIRAALHREQCDSELIETRKENEVLSLFWSKYNAFKFNGAIRNQTEEDEQFKSEYWKDFHPKNLLIALRYAS